MATLPHLESKRMCSWWWDSHISPKNSKWLQENLTDMDAKVKAMIKLINEDADSFARRAEMYYKKRPELMKLVEEFYRAYRALAERYDHATGVIRQAHRTMAEAFPNQVPLVPVDDSPTNLASEADPCTPDISHPVRPLFEPNDLQKDALGLSSYQSYGSKQSGSLTDESVYISSRKGTKQVNDLFGSRGYEKFAEGRVRKELNFCEEDGKEQDVQNNENCSSHSPAFSESEQEGKPEKQIILLKEALAKLEAEKEAGLFQYQKCLEELSKLESEVSCAQEDSRGFSERASKAEVEAQTLKEALIKVEAEKEAGLLQYQHYLDRISYLENVHSHSQEDAAELNERASRAESESQFLKEELDKVKIDKDAAFDKYKQCLEMVSTLEHKLEHAEEDARKFCDQAEKAESEIENLKHAMAKLTSEKEAAMLQYQHCLETISSLEHKLSCAEEEVRRLTGEIEIGNLKLKSADERCILLERSNQSLHSELESLVLKTGSQSQELADKQKELGRLWTCIQEERLRFMEAETAFQTLQHLHSQAQEELRSLETEIQSKAQILRDMETHNQSLQDEILKAKEENKSLIELKLSSAMSMKDMQNEIFVLMETRGKLEQEVELRVDQRNALQQEIYCLKEELNELNKKHQAILEQVDAVGLNPNCLESSVKELRDENSDLKKACQSQKGEIEVLLKKLEIFEQLLEKNVFLEISISDLNAELEAVRGKVKALEESYQSLLAEKSVLLDEKAALVTQLQIATENLVKLSEKNIILENSLSDVYDELEGLKEKSKILEDSCQVLLNQKAALANEKDTLSSQLGTTLHTLEDLEKRHAKLQEKFLYLQEEKESTLCTVQELQVSLDAEKQKHANFAQLSERQLAGMESQIRLLQEEGQRKKREFEEGLDKSLDSQIEIFILQRCAQDLEEKNLSLLVEFQKLLEASKLSEKLISELEKENIEQQMEIQSLFDQTNTLTTGMYQLLKALDIVLDRGCKDKIVVDKFYLDHILNKVEATKNSLCQTDEENQQLIVEMSVLFTLLQQVRLEAENLQMEKNIIENEFKNGTKQFSALQSEVIKLHEMNEDLRLKLRDGDCKEKALMIQLENLQGKLLDIQGAYQNLQKENFEVLEEKKSFGKECLLLEEKSHKLEEENHMMLGEILSLGNLSLIFKNYGDEKSWELKVLHNDVDKLCVANATVLEKLSSMKRKLEDVHIENLNLKEALQRSEDELKILASVRDQLSCDIIDEKNLLHMKEMELLEAEKKLSTKETEKSVLHKVVEDMKREFNDIKMIKNDQKNQIFKLSEENNHLRKENARICEANERLGFELQHSHEENEILITREQTLHSELQKGRNEIESWETQAVASFGESQISTICQALFEMKVHELTKACEILEGASTSKDTDIELLKERVNVLEEENDGLKARLAAYGPAINSLRDCISFLEKNTCLLVNLSNSSNEKAMDTEFASLHQNRISKNQNAIVGDALSDLQDLQTRIKAIEEAMTRKNVSPTFEASETKNRLMTKDIILDQISECSSYGTSRRQDVEDDNRMLELWETGFEDGSFDLTVDKAKKVVTWPFRKGTDYQQVEAVNQQRDGYHTSDVLDEEYSLDKFENSGRSIDSCGEGNKRKVLERLHSDVQKLTNLQITVQDLKRKLDSTEKGTKGKAIVECDTLKGQLEEAEETILKLFDLNGKLKKNTEDISFSDKKSAMELEENGSLKRRRILDQGRRLSEKIGRLQLEVQKIQFTLLKIDDEKVSKGRTRISEFRKRVLLRDYLYGGVRTSHRQKKAPFCGCVQPLTQGD